MPLIVNIRQMYFLNSRSQFVDTLIADNYYYLLNRDKRMPCPICDKRVASDLVQAIIVVAERHFSIPGTGDIRSDLPHVKFITTRKLRKTVCS